MKQYFVIVGLSTLLLTGGCPYPVASPQQAGTYQVVPSRQPLATKLMVFGGEGHKTYLGCLNCDPMAYDSIFNAVGPYGRCVGLFTDNLFCRGPFNKFGSKGPLQARSACGSGASDPPVIVDQYGNYYGRFSIGGPFGHQDSVCGMFSRFNHTGTCEIAKWVCEQDGDGSRDTFDLDSNDDDDDDDE